MILNTDKRGTKYEEASITFLSDSTNDSTMYVEENILITLRRHQQSWFYTEIRKPLATDYQRTMRVVIRRNSYDEQSYASLYQLTQEGWVEIHSIGITGTPAHQISCWSDLKDVKVMLFRHTAEILWDVDRFMNNKTMYASLPTVSEMTPEQTKKLLSAMISPDASSRKDKV